ncbi:MAG: deoxyribose-phosphate aldolase [Peptococcaceae bacterium]|nr:deoxyribose-phosphate aldolase [Peptococcaceae bacterium]
MQIPPERVAALIDHTLLRPDATAKDILRLCAEAVRCGFKAVCVNPGRVALAAGALAGSGVAVCSVAGFPLGAGTTETKAAEAAGAVRDGAAEIDLVINIGLLKDGRNDLVFRDVRAVVDAVTALNPGGLVKAIIETCHLTDEEKKTACRLCEQAGARFIKTSTGMGPAGATVEDIELIRETVSPGTGIKASGGIRTLDQALRMVRAGATRIGTSSGVQIMRELNQT